MKPVKNSLRLQNRFWKDGSYRSDRRIGSGAHGDVYLGFHVPTGIKVAIKFEPIRTNQNPQPYDAEMKAYGVLPKADDSFVSIRWNGIETGYHVMVMDLLGSNLEQLFNTCHRKFSLKTTLLLAEELLTRIEYIHSCGILHRDIKPENLMMGRKTHEKRVYVIDYGRMNVFWNFEADQHIPWRVYKDLTNIDHYASINTHLGVEQGRRDDLESLAYVLIYFLRGDLPWQNIRALDKQQESKLIRDEKIATNPDILCSGLPPEFSAFLKYTRALGFQEKPDYSHVRKFFRELFARMGYKYDRVFDWNTLK